MKREQRDFTLSGIEIREDAGKRVLRGYAAVFASPSVDMGFIETIRAGAFAETIKKDDIRALWNHNANFVLGRNTAGTLRLSEDEKGLVVEIDLPDTQAGRDAHESIKRRDVTGMSFGFGVPVGGDQWSLKDGKDCRELIRVVLYDVSPVAYPAYPDTSVAVRAALSASGIDLDSLTAALGRAAAGQEIRADDSAALDAAIGLINKFRNKKQSQNDVAWEARYAILRRELDLIES